ncbi:MAG: hypothetical protein ACK2UU_02035 [Anaerolineae bacterium]
MRLGFFAYPWDLLDEGPEAAVEAMARQLGCNAIALNANYHHARFLRPRAKGPKTLELPGAVAAFQPQPDLYPDDALMPVPDPALVESGVLAQARAACAKDGLDFGLWTVGLHNSTLGEQNRHLCMETCFGDCYTYSLCPAHAPVRAFLQGVIRDLCAQFQPDRIIQEAVGYLGARHWVHHELFFVDWDEGLELLLSLCFCAACQARGDAAGLDVPALRQNVAGLAEHLLHQERGSLPPAFAQSYPTSLLFEIRDLPEYLRVRADSVTELVRGLQSAAAEQGASLDLIPASFQRPVSRAWLEGAHLGQLGTVSDSLLIPAYHDSAAQVAADLDWAARLAPGSALAAGLNACNPAVSSAAEIAAQAQACVAAGCQGIYTYNYGLLTPDRLGWVAGANREVQGQ